MLLVTPPAAAAPGAATAPPARLLALAYAGSAQDSPAQLQLGRAWTDEAGTGGRGVRYEVFRRVAALRASAERTGAVEHGVALAGWERLGTITVEGEGGYRVPVDDHSSSVPTPSAPGALALNPSPSVNAPLRFALVGVRPNPALGRAMTVEFVLPTAQAARLELLDVMGRLVVGRDVGVLGAGRHAVNLGDGRRLAPGIYLVRLRQGADVRVTRAAVLE